MNIFIYSHTLRPLCLQTLVREATLEMIKTWLKGELAPRAAFCFAFFNAAHINLSSTSVSERLFPSVLFCSLPLEINISCFGEPCMYKSFVFSRAVNASYICLHQLVRAYQCTPRPPFGPHIIIPMQCDSSPSAVHSVWFNFYFLTASVCLWCIINLIHPELTFAA